jgi:hypothetical protein
MTLRGSFGSQMSLERLRSWKLAFRDEDGDQRLATVCFIAYGLRIAITVDHHCEMGALIDRLPPGSKPVATGHPVDRRYSIALSKRNEPDARGLPPTFSTVYGDGERLVQTEDFHTALDVFESNLQLYVAEHSRSKIFVHAGVVGWGGEAILIPGRSCSGKTSLVAQLVRAGATYYSDEYAVIDAKGRVHPYPKALGIRSKGSLRQTRTSVESMGGRAGLKPLPVGLVLITEFRDGAKWAPRRLSGGEAVLAMLAHTVCARTRPKAALGCLAHVACAASFLEGPRGEAEQTAAAVLANAGI